MINKNIILIILIVVIVTGVAGLAWQQSHIKKLKADRDTYQGNTYALMSDIRRYKTSDSLNVVSIARLDLKLSEFKRFREKDARLIADLQADKKRLESVTTAQTRTIYELSGKMRDSLASFGDHVDTLKCVEITNKWFHMTGCVDKKNDFSGQFENRDSLVYVEHVIPRRFLFFKFGVRERRQEMTSRNPHTVIESAEFITIRK